MQSIAETKKGIFRANTSIWVEKYRPRTVDEYVGDPELKTQLRTWIKDQEIPHLLFEGVAGTGKSTAAHILVLNIPCDYIYINASKDNSIEYVRTKVFNFCTTTGFESLKIVILDECLDENTLVTILRDGKIQQVSIKDVDDKTDLVKSLNTKTNQIEWKPFELFDQGEKEVYEFTFENGEKVICTPTHKWFVEVENEIKVFTTEEIILKNIMHILTF